MKEIGLFLDYAIQDYPKGDNELIINLLRKSFKIIDKDINNDNGLAGYKLKTHLNISKSISLSEAEPNHILNNKYIEKQEGTLSYLKNKQNIKFIVCNSALKPSIQSLNLENIIYLQTNKTNNYMDNVFSITRVSNESKVSQIKYFISNFKKLQKVYFFHDNKRLKNHENILNNNIKNIFFSYDFSDLKYDKEIIKTVNIYLKKFTKHDVLILDVGNRVTKYFFKFFNENPNKIGLVLIAFVTLEGKYSKFNFPLVEIKSNQVISATLALKQVLKRTNISIVDRELELFLTSSYRLDFPLLLKQAADKIKSIPVNHEQLSKGIMSGLRDIDGKKDIFVGLRHNLAFRNNENIIKDNYSFIFPESMFDGKNFHKVFYHTQIMPFGTKVKEIHINTINFDILRITNVNISNGTWGSEFILNITSKHKNPIDFIVFNNLSMINREYETKLINSTKSAYSGSFSNEYYIVANFDFNPKADNYPFDWQHLYIGYTISDKEKYGYIQPVPEQLLDKEFNIEGWRIRDAITGIKNTKMIKYTDYNLTQKVSTEEEARVGWTLSRANYITLTKIAIPLIFLLFLNYYVLFFTFENVSRQIGILTTTFLSGIALYFSAERPQPLRLTTIDLIFIWYYIQSGIVIVTSAICSQLGEEIFYLGMNILKIEAPLGLISIIAFLFYRVKAVRLRPNIS